MSTTLVKRAPTRTRRRHSPEFKAQVIVASQRIGVSIAAVALANDLNANLLRRWIKDGQAASAISPPIRHTTAVVSVSPGIVPALRQTSELPDTRDIRLDLRRGELAVQIAWPISHANHLGAWLKELLS
jgi:transposase